MADLTHARQFLAGNHHGVLVTRRIDDALQSSPIAVGLDGSGRAVISTTKSSAKVRNIRRDPRIALCVVTDQWFGRWGHYDGIATVIDQPEAVELLVEYYRTVAGEHPDWQEYRAAMVRDQRVLIQIELQHAAGPAAGE